MAFKAILSIQVTQDDEPYFSAELDYDNLDYKGVVIVESAFKSAADKLTDVGFQMALEKGALTPEQADKIKAILA